MALSVTGLDSNGRVTPKGTNVIIPMQSAGIGDIVFCKSGSDPYTPSNLLVVGRGTNSATSATLNSNTYYRYGVIYGFVAGMAMIIADKADESLYWATSNSPTLPSGTPEYGGGTCLMRNGKKATYVQMNTERNASYITGSSASQPTDGLLTSAYQSTPLTSSTFASSANTETKQRFGSWLEYIRQTLRVNGAPGTCFGAVASGVKVHEFGRWMTKKLHAQSTSAFPAANACSTYKVSNTGDAAGNWWLPSMFELGELMIDSHLGLVNEGLINDVSTSSYRWSCVRFSSSNAWRYDYAGVSSYIGFSDYRLTVRPVTLLKLV
ncbi:MAG: hypothetical protein IK084_03275 [Bacteroidaceae bacterium]|nr:hypothetical protein [Bacteroidaceae bacterium]